MVFDCDNYTNGTSGGPFLAHVNPKTGDGWVIGVIGGYQQGGDTPNVSYSAQVLLPRSWTCTETATSASPVAAVRLTPAGPGTIRSRSASSSADGTQPAAAAFALTCSGDVAPAITDEQPGWAARPPMATSRSVTPCCCAQPASSSTLSSFSSVM